MLFTFGVAWVVWVLLVYRESVPGSKITQEPQEPLTVKFFVMSDVLKAVFNVSNFHNNINILKSFDNFLRPVWRHSICIKYVYNK